MIDRFDAPIFINGERVGTVDYMDRGLSYGDGLFETLAVRDGQPRHWARHRARLRSGLERLRIPFMDFKALETELFYLAEPAPVAVVKVIITRGVGARGYAPVPGRTPTRIVSLHDMPDIPASYYHDGITVRWCDMRLALNPQLAGIKHLNRLEQVMARAEWSDAGIAEGLMRDMEGRVVAGTAGNLFVEHNGQLLTPALHRCGVAGVTRAVIMSLAESWSIPLQETDISPGQVGNAEALFLCNSVVGILPITRLLGEAGRETRFPVSALTRKLLQAIR